MAIKYWYSCSKLSSIDFNRRELIRNSTSELLEYKLICDLLPVMSCPFEQQRFEALNLWMHRYGTLKWPSDSNLADYLDSLVSRAGSYLPEVVFGSAMIVFSQNYFSLLSYRKNWQTSPYADYISESFDLFASEMLTVQGKIDINPNSNQGYFSSVSIKTSYNSQDLNVILNEASIQEYLDKNV